MIHDISYYIFSNRFQSYNFKKLETIVSSIYCMYFLFTLSFIYNMLLLSHTMYMNRYNTIQVQNIPLQSISSQSICS